MTLESSSSRPHKIKIRSTSTFFLLSICINFVNAFPTTTTTTSGSLGKRAEDKGGLSKDTNLSLEQVDSIGNILNRTAYLSWEIGTHLESILEYSFPSLSPFSSSYSRISPDTSPQPLQIQQMTSYLLNEKPPSDQQLQIVRDGSAADPVSIAPFLVLSNFTLSPSSDQSQLLPSNTTNEGVSKETVVRAVENQLEALLERTPRTNDGAISHRTETTELWSDFVYMVPPFLAYYGVLTSNTSLIDESYNQCRLYRQYLRDERTGLWRHIVLGDSPDSGLWSTGNGWAAAGMLRTLATMQNSDEYKDRYESEIEDLMNWVEEIVTGAWNQPMSGGLLHNYLNETSTFVESSGTALLSSATYRLFTTRSNYSSSSSLLTAAENAYQTLTSPRHLSNPQGVLQPVVNPMDYSSQLNNVKSDASGNVSPEGQAFVLLMESARRDWIEGGGDVTKLGATGASSARLSIDKMSTVTMGLTLLTIVGLLS